MGDTEQVEAEPKQAFVEASDSSPAVEQTSPVEQSESPNNGVSDKEQPPLDDPPINIRQLTIKNLDTGEEFVIVSSTSIYILFVVAHWEICCFRARTIPISNSIHLRSVDRRW
ncbi:hypothetical protein EON65_53820 [archaeon]|nr:MAG: hypothetical protein EON65_53820 [archaeon]